VWKSVGVEYISVEKYIDKIYNKDDTWLLCFGSAPKEYTWLPEGGYKNTEMFLEKLMCTKETYGNKLKVGFIEYGRGETIKEAFDFNDRRMQETAPVCALVKNRIVYHVP
jgi:hypothetical protein